MYRSYAALGSLEGSRSEKKSRERAESLVIPLLNTPLVDKQRLLIRSSARLWLQVHGVERRVVTTFQARCVFSP